MSASIHAYEAGTYSLNSDVNWIEYYPKILFLARRFVYLYRIPCWYGQEEDMVEDVAQETVRRLIERMHKAARGEAAPIASLEYMTAAIVHNYVLDLRRRDRRIVRFPADDDAQVSEMGVYARESMPEEATEHVYHEWLFLRVAHAIVQLPCKQRRAILIDLANRMSFETRPTPLQAAFLALGIDLQDYQQPLPENPVERARHATLVSLAYKRIAQLPRTQQLFSAA